MSYYTSTLMTVACVVCGFTGSPYAVSLHSCRIHESGGRCEDYPCCGHTDGDGCQTLPEHTSEYWSEAMTSGDYRAHFEYGSPEWYDACEMDERYSDYGRYDDEGYESMDDCIAAGMHGDSWNGTGTKGIAECAYCGGDFAYEDDDEE